MKKALGIFATIIVAGGLVFYLFYDGSQGLVYDSEQPTEVVNNTPPPSPSTGEDEEIDLPARVLLDVPFFAQAPTANWSDPRQQDGCEEASMLMAHLWLTDDTMTVQQAEQEIIDVSEYQKTKYGEYIDRSLPDTAKLFEEYYKHSDYEVKRKVTAEDIKKELAQGHLVIVPTNGQILNNPNYTGEGPLTHMLPIIGYDEAKKEFITNDPGTRNGRQFRFTYQNMMDSIYEYETGTHEGYTKTDTVMMVVKKSS